MLNYESPTARCFGIVINLSSRGSGVAWALILWLLAFQALPIIVLSVTAAIGIHDGYFIALFAGPITYLLGIILIRLRVRNAASPFTRAFTLTSVSILSLIILLLAIMAIIGIQIGLRLRS